MHDAMQAQTTSLKIVETKQKMHVTKAEILSRTAGAPNRLHLLVMERNKGIENKMNNLFGRQFGLAL